MVMDKNADIQECQDDESIQEVGYSFMTIDEINDCEQSRTVDTIGVITLVGPIVQVNIKSSGT